MADEKTFKNIDESEISKTIKKKSEQLKSEILEDREKRKSETTEKLDNPTKTAKKAQNEEVIAGGLQTVLSGINSILKSKAPEFEHEDFEIETIAELSAPVLNKHFDIEALEHKEEAKLIGYLVMCEMEKGRRFLMRKKEEAKNRKEEAEQQAEQEQEEPDEPFLTNEN